MEFYLILFVVFVVSTLPAGALAYGASTMMPKIMGCIIVPLIAISTGILVAIGSVSWILSIMSNDPANANIDGPAIFGAALTVCIYIAQGAAFLAFIVSLVIWLRTKQIK